MSDAKLEGFGTKVLDFGKQRGQLLYNESTRQLQIHTSRVLREITNNMGNIKEFSIGRTSIDVKRKRRRAVNPFNRLNKETWDTKNLTNRYKEWRLRKYDGLIVIGVFTKLDKPAGRKQTSAISKKKLFRHENFTIALKQDLVNYYNYVKCDPRIMNDTHATGNTKKASAQASCLYLAYKIRRTTANEEFENETDDDEEEEESDED